MKKKSKVTYKRLYSPVNLFTSMTYWYAGLILVGTCAPLLIKVNIDKIFYNSLSMAYALTYIAGLLIREKLYLLEKAIPILLINTGLTMAISFVIASVDYLDILLFWICLLPFSLYILAPKRLTDLNRILHAGVIIMILGIIASSTMGANSVAITSDLKHKMDIGGRQLSLSAFLNKDTVTISTPLADYIANSREVMYSNNNILIPYSSKPLIALFWIGGSIVVMSSVLCLIKVMFRKILP